MDGEYMNNEELRTILKIDNEAKDNIKLIEAKNNELEKYIAQEISVKEAAMEAKYKEEILRLEQEYNNKLKKKRYGKNQKIYIYNESDPDFDGNTELLVLKQEYFFIKGKVDYNYKKEFLIPLPNNSSEEDLIEYLKSKDLNPALSRRLKDKNIRLWKAIADSKTENWRLIFISKKIII